MLRKDIRALARRSHRIYSRAGFGNFCPSCLKELGSEFHVHEAFVKRGAVHIKKQPLIMVPENCIPVCPKCHGEIGQTEKMKAYCLAFASKTIGLTRVGQWYINLWQEHGLAIPKGYLVSEKKVPLNTSLIYMKDGLDLLGIPYHSWGEEWMFENRDLRYIVINSLRGKGEKLPETLNGVRTTSLFTAFDNGYWLHYISGVLAIDSTEVISLAKRLGEELS